MSQYQDNRGQLYEYSLSMLLHLDLSQNFLKHHKLSTFFAGIQILNKTKWLLVNIRVTNMTNNY